MIFVQAGRPQEALLCAKAKRQLQSAQPEWESTTRYGDEPFKSMDCWYILLKKFDMIYEDRESLNLRFTIRKTGPQNKQTKNGSRKSKA
ncbi:hypothetical protein [Lysinibacillus sp. G4S2]|uniref:hypothetical protein n=1 Tax=Lysinibacillus sp. G4S2 TaxID=3055859 RepID=UPI0025A12BF4|nr:hypothetical protein [Lysinibacillus sp. G4S2]MDM5246976.1 hypothetical protein [Lysinibacillus sp. G4S2]